MREKSKDHRPPNKVKMIDAVYEDDNSSKQLQSLAFESNGREVDYGV